MPKPKRNNPATEYANNVLSGKIPACLYVRQACRRYLDDLKRTDIYFDEDKASQAVAYIEMLRHTKAEWYKQNLLLEGWQKFGVYNIFGFYKLNGTRRFRKSYWEMPKKNGKSPLASGIACYLHNGEDEPGAEVYCVGTQLDQSAIVFEYAHDMMEMFCEEHGFEMTLSNSINNKVIIFEKSKMKPLAFDAKETKDGFMVTAAVIDEYHAHPSNAMYDILSNGTAARRNPHLMAITTAGQNRNSACYAHREHCTRVLSGQLKDDSLFALIYGIDEEDLDNWDKEEVWRKANPNYGISVKPDYMESQLAEARESEAKKVLFLIKHLNVWTDAAETWIPDGTWMANQIAFPNLDNMACYGGLDLASTNDFCAFALTFPYEGKKFKKYRFYITDESLKKRGKQLQDDIRQWVKDGYVRLCEGNTVDYGWIKQDILSDAARYNLKGIAVDPWNSSQLIIELQDEGINAFKCGQGVSVMASPTSQYDKDVKEGLIQHGNNPVMRWMIGNVAIVHLPNDNLKVSKDKSSDKVDGVVADIMSEIMMAQPEQTDYNPISWKRN